MKDILSMHDYVNITTPHSPNDLRLSPPDQTVPCLLYFFLKQSYFCWGRFLEHSIEELDQVMKKTQSTELYTIFLIIFNVLIQ